jgi:hypothetical protein
MPPMAHEPRPGVPTRVRSRGMDPRRRRLSPGVPLLLAATILSSGVARAQTPPASPATDTPPAATAPPSAANPPAPPPAPAAPPPPAQAPTATPPPGEPQNVSPPPTPAPPLALPPTPTPPPPLELDQRTPQSPSEAPVPFYRKEWFWGTVGLVVLTTAIILVSSASSGSGPPTTTLGNMHAF